MCTSPKPGSSEPRASGVGTIILEMVALFPLGLPNWWDVNVKASWNHLLGRTFRERINVKGSRARVRKGTDSSGWI